ncbi:hypothetical protein ACE38W_17475 [Chitinophaga sp. Hz27]|uniref:Uncharacterized protein n=1 Tax=Chitinophaga silvatica TaxID=2282649 RepID=A0A3E1YH80_9BACT|nr:hypothetical protein [Chitinophaga silvatica]RFS26785.1 hypothetical protein DVR12_03085 [Chitinophaga silvatica]
MLTYSKMQIIEKCTHFLKARQDRYPPFIFEGTYVYAQKIAEEKIGPKPNIYIISFLNGSKLLVKAHRNFEQSYFNELKTGKIYHANQRDIEGYYKCLVVSDEDIDIPVHLRPLQDQIL